MKLNEEPKYACPCCGNIVFYEKQNFEICNICNWQDDNIQFLDWDYSGGANILSLNDYRKNFLMLRCQGVENQEIRDIINRWNIKDVE